MVKGKDKRTKTGLPSSCSTDVPPYIKSNIPLFKNNPATKTAEAILSACNHNGSLSRAVEHVFANILPSELSTLSRNDIENIKDYYDNNKELQDTMQFLTDSVMSYCGDSQKERFDLRNTPEIFANARPRGRGKTIEKLEEACNYPGFFGFDVLQQTPHLLKMKNDQLHIVATREEKLTSKTASGVWKSLDIDVTGCLVKEDSIGREIICKIFPESPVTIELKWLVKPVLTKDNGIAGCIRRCAPDERNVGLAYAKEVQAWSNKFKRCGDFLDNSKIEDLVDAVTPKIDGVPLYIKRNDNHCYAVSRNGTCFEVEFNGEFDSRPNRRHVAMLVEVWPNLESPEAVYLIKAWQFGVSNEFGFTFHEELLHRKKIHFKFDDVPPIRVQLPSFETDFSRTDGLVMHVGTNQYFIKPYPTVDIKDKSTKDVLEKMNVTAEWRDGLWEYGVEHGHDSVFLRPIKLRTDKLRENALVNITGVINGPDIDSWIEMLEDRGFKIPDVYGMKGPAWNETKNE